MAGRGILRIKVLGDDTHLAKTLDRSGPTLAKWAKGAMVAFAGLQIVGQSARYMWEASEAALADAQAQSVLDGVVSNVTGATKSQLGALKEWVEQTQLQYGVTEEQLRPALQKLTVATGDLGKAQADSNLAMDVARGTGKEYSAVVDAIVKAENGQMTGLQRLGVKVKDAWGKTKDLVSITKDLALAYGGSAMNWAESAAGKMQRFKLRMSEAKETMGGGFLPMIEVALPYLEKFAGWMGSLAESFGATAKAKGAGAAIGELIRSAMNGIADWFGDSGGEMIGKGVAGALKLAFDDVIPALVEGLAKGVYKAGEGFLDDQHMKRVTNRLQDQLERNTKAGVSGGLEQAIQDLRGQHVYTGLGFQEDIKEEDIAALMERVGDLAKKYSPWDVFMDEGAGFYAGMGEGMSVLATKYTEAEAAAQLLTEETTTYKDALLGVFASRMSVASIWQEAEGSLQRYLALVDIQSQSFQQFGTNVQTLVGKFPAYKDDILAAISQLGPAAPDMMAKILGGTPAEQQAAVDSFRLLAGGGLDQLALDAATKGTTAGDSLSAAFTAAYSKANPGGAMWEYTYSGWEAVKTALAATYTTSGAYQAGLDIYDAVKRGFGVGGPLHVSVQTSSTTSATGYDSGGYLPPGPSVVVNKTGKPEPVSTDEQWKQIQAGGPGRPSSIIVQVLDSSQVPKARRGLARVV